MIEDITNKNFITTPGSYKTKDNGIKKLYAKVWDDSHSSKTPRQTSLENKAIKIIRSLTEAGYKAYFTGGWVRDYILNSPSSDIDIVTNAPKEMILKLYPTASETGQSYGVYIVEEEGDTFEIANFRKDGEYVNGRKPEMVSLASSREDSQRRDLTINGLYFDPLKQRIIDYVGGVEDIQRKLIKTIGNPSTRFAEDRLRMLRTVRFAVRFGFKIDQETENAILSNASSLIPAVPKSIVWKELHKMAEYPHFQEAIIELHRLKLLSTLIPALKEVSLESIKERVRSFERFPSQSPLVLYLMELIPECSLEEQIKICRDLELSRHDIQFVELTYKMREAIQKELRQGKVEPIEWVNLYAAPDSQTCLEVVLARDSEENRIALIQKHANQRDKLKAHIDRTAQKKKLITGTLLEKYGIPKGKVLSLLIQEGEKLAIQNNLTDPEAVIAMLKKTPYWPVCTA